MSNRIWGLDFLSRRGSNQLGEDAPTVAKKPSSRVQSLGTMRRQPASGSMSAGSSGDDDYEADCPSSNGMDQDTKPSSVETRSERLSTDAPKTPAGAVKAPHSSSSDSGPGSESSHSGLNSSDKPSSSLVNRSSESTADAAGLQNGASNHTTPMPIAAAAAAATATAAAPDDGASACSRSATPIAGGGHQMQRQSECAPPRHDNPSTSSNYGSTASSSVFHDSGRNNIELSDAIATAYIPSPPRPPQQQPHHPQDVGAATYNGGILAPGGTYGSGTHESALTGAGQQGYDVRQYAQDASPFLQGMAGAGFNLPGGPMDSYMGAMGSPGGMMPAGPHALLMLLGELQREVGLNERQTAAAAALMSRYSNAASAMNPSGPSPALAGTWPSTPSTGSQGQSSNPFLAPGGPIPAGLTGAGFGPPAGSPLASMQHSGAFGGYDSSQHSSSAYNVQLSKSSDGTGAGMSSSGVGILPGGLSSPEAIYGTDGLDVPGTAQVAVHNVPFKWCNTDLEALFRQLPGYLDAQLLFHENGRSKGVGVALFSDAGSASEACGKLSGVQADGRKLELVLMSPDNHISFSCKQVAVLGLPWEYTASDVRALIEAAAEADGAPAGEAGVEAVEVAYREDGKSEGRAIATFRSRAQAHAAITRLHGRETLAGLRMRLFYLHEQQQRLQLLAQTPQSLITSVGQLALDTPSPASTAALTLNGNQGAAAPRNNPGDGGRPCNQQSTGPLGAAEEGSDMGEKQKQAEEGDGSDVTSARSSFDKDQGPVILHVSGLMESVTREQLRELFSQAGEVTKVDIPDGGRSMGYGFITFSNPQAAEQAMLLFNNYPLSGGAIHVAYSTSATAKARQQALRQARKATLGSHAAAAGSSTPRLSMDGRLSATGGAVGGASSSSRPLNRPGGMQGMPGSAGLGGVLGTGGLASRRTGLGYDDSLPLSDLSGGLDALSGAVPAGRHSFDHPGFISPGLAHGRAGNTFSSLGAVGLGGALSGAGGTHRVGYSAAGSPRVSAGGFAAGLSTVQLQHLQVLQAAGVPAAAAAALAAASTGATTSPYDGFGMEQLMMQMAAADPAGFGTLNAQGFGPAAGTPTHGGLGGNMFGSANRGAAGLLGGGLGGANPAASFGGVLGTTGASPAAGFLSGAFAGANPVGPSAGHSSDMAPALSPFGPAVPSAAGAGSGLKAAKPNRQVLVTGLPVGLEDAQALQLFQICGPVERLSKTANDDIVLVVYESLEGASKAVQVLDGTSMPSGRTLTVHFAPEDLAPSGAAVDPGAAASFGAGYSVFGAGSNRASKGDPAASAVGAWEGLGGSINDQPAATFGQGWGSAASRPPFGQGMDTNMYSSRGASWDGGATGARPPMPNTAAHSGGRLGGGGPSPLRSISPAGGISSSMPPSASAGRLPLVYMASPVSSFQGGAAAGGLFGRAGAASFSADCAPLLAPGNVNPYGMSTHAFGYESAGAAVSEALLILDEEVTHQAQQQQQGVMRHMTGAGGSWGSLNTSAGAGAASAGDAAAVSAGMPSAWGTMPAWDGGAMTGAAGVSAGSNIVRQAAAAPALSGHSVGSASVERLSGMAEGPASDGGSTQGSA